MLRRTLLPAIAAAFVLAASAEPALAAQPEIERIAVEETFEDEFLSEVCGVPVTTTASGQIAVRLFPEREGEAGPVEVRTISISLTAQAGDNTVRFRDVGADVTRIAPDGTVILSISGQIPFEFTGVLKLDVETGEVLLEPQRHRAERQLERVCEALTG